MTWVEVFAAGLIGAVIASLFWVIFNTYRIQDLLIKCEAEKDLLRREVIAVNRLKLEAEETLVRREIQYRVLGATPVSRLIGGSDE